MNLLPVNARRAKDPGDSKEMVAARRRFFAGGALWPLWHGAGRAFCLALAQTARDPHSPHILDAGCGEGWYSRQAAAALTAAGLCPEMAGYDLSKPAVRLAAGLA